MKTLYTKRLILRPYTTEDFDALFNILSDEITMQYWANPFSAEKIKSRIERSLQSYNTGFGKFAVIHKESGKLIGDCGITLVETDGNIENNFGYIIHPPFQGNGYGTESARACVNYAFCELMLKRITANMVANNTASIRVAEKLGMAIEKEFFKNSDGSMPFHMYYLTNNYFC